MADATRPLIQRAAFAACLMLTAAAHAAAQAAPQPPVVAPAPTKPELMSRYDFHLTAAVLSIADERFTWDTHFGGSMDALDYKVGRLSCFLDYQAILGSEYRMFDPNQGNFTLEGSASVRAGANTEFVGMFHHVSRHLSDRLKPKEVPVAWNELGVRLLRRFPLGSTTVDVDVEAGWAIEHAYVDYRWMSEAHVLARRRISERTGAYLHASGQFFGVDGTVPGRGSQAGGAMEAGIRLEGRGGSVELFAGVEKRVDADVLDRQPRHWGLAGFRLLSR